MEETITIRSAVYSVLTIRKTRNKTYLVRKVKDRSKENKKQASMIGRESQYRPDHENTLI